MITCTTFHLQGGIDAEVKARNISPSNQKLFAAGSGHRGYVQTSLTAVPFRLPFWVPRHTIFIAVCVLEFGDFHACC